MNTRIIAAVLLVSTIAMSGPALATNGREAVGKCIDAAGCTWAMDKDGKNIEIITADGVYIHCADAKSECTIPRKTGAPKRGNVGGMTAATLTR